jgi:O-methyltransferase involved in polyketide biosynthesis
MLSYKTRAISAEEPKCRLERVAADVTDQAQRAALFAAGVGVRTLRITEGLLMYLACAAVEALAADAARYGIRRWLLDSSSLDLARMMGWDARRSIESVRAPGHLRGAELLDAVRSNGWTQLCFRSYSPDAAEVAAERIAAMVQPFVEKGIPVPAAPVEDSSGLYLFGRE